MRTAWGPTFGLDKGRMTWRIAIYVALVGWTLALIYMQARGRIEIGRALVLLAFPLVAVGAAIRPSWVVLFMAAVPIGQIQIAPMRALVLLVLVTLAGLFVVRGTISFGWRSGFLGLLVLVATAIFYRVQLTGDDALIARGIMNQLAFVVLLGLLTYNATRLGDLRGGHLVNALLFGLSLSVVLEHTLLSETAGILGASVLPIGRPIAYLAAAGFAICFARLIISTADGDFYHPVVHLLLSIVFLLAMIPGLDRGAWLSALIAVVFISSWAGKRTYWLLIPIVATVMLIVPVTRERVVPSEQQLAGGGYTTGRIDLWTRLWDQEIVPALPFGNGFGHTVTLSSEDIFGSGATSFDPSQTGGFVYPHNDFVYWMVELGLLGLLGVLVFWGQLLLAFRFVSRVPSANSTNVHILGGILITGFVLQMVGSAFLFTAVAVPFFIVAGFVFGARRSVAG